MRLTAGRGTRMAGMARRVVDDFQHGWLKMIAQHFLHPGSTRGGVASRS